MLLFRRRNVQASLQVSFPFLWSARFLTLAQGGEEETIRLLDESTIVKRVKIDENGGRLQFVPWLIPKSSHFAVRQLVRPRANKSLNPIQEDSVAASVCKAGLCTGWLLKRRLRCALGLTISWARERPACSRLAVNLTFGKILANLLLVPDMHMVTNGKNRLLKGQKTSTDS